MCKRHSFILTRAGKVLDGQGLTDSHTEIRELHGLKNTDDTVNAYEWQPPTGWPEADWEGGLTKDTEVFTPKSSHLNAMGKHVKALYPTMEAWDAGDKPRQMTESEQITATELIKNSEYITVPETVLPNGTIVPSFQVAKYPMARGKCAIPVSVATEKPWNNITYLMACAVSQRAGLNLLRETQALAIALDASRQDINWTGGKVGEGKMFQGIHKWNVNSAQAGNYESADPEERSWLQLSNGERIYHFAGNLYSWIFDDVQGDENGIVKTAFAEDSPSLTTAPYPSKEKGMGWRPNAGADWTGRALFRGSCWGSESVAGAFSLNRDWPDLRTASVGVRCTH